MPQILKPTPRSAPTTQGPRINQGNEPLWLHDPAAFGWAFRLFRMSFLLTFGSLALQFVLSLLSLTGVTLPVIMSLFKHLFALLSVGSGGLFLWGLWQMTQQAPLTQRDNTLRNVGATFYGLVVVSGFFFNYLFFVILSKRLPVGVLIDYILLLFTVLGVGLTAWVVQQLLPKKRSSYVPVWGPALTGVVRLLLPPTLFRACGKKCRSFPVLWAFLHPSALHHLPGLVVVVGGAFAKVTTAQTVALHTVT